MKVGFKLDKDKVLAASVYIASRNFPDLTTGKMMKLLFLADKYHLVRFGRIITGDRYDAMKDGPVPCFAYNVFKELSRKPYSDSGRKFSQSLDVDFSGAHPRFSARTAFDQEQLSPSDIFALNETLTEHGNKSFEELSDFTHEMPAYNKAWRSKSFFKKSAHMNFEDFFDDDHGAMPGVKEEVMEDDYLQSLLAKP